MWLHQSDWVGIDNHLALEISSVPGSEIESQKYTNCWRISSTVGGMLQVYKNIILEGTRMVVGTEVAAGALVLSSCEAIPQIMGSLLGPSLHERD